MWLALTVDDCLTGLAGAERAAVRTAALAAGQSDPLAETIAQVVQDVRGYVAACKANSLDSDTTKIPAELQADALAIIRYRALNRLNLRSLLSESRTQEYRDALRKMEMVAACKFAIEQPTTASTQIVTADNAVQLVSNTARRATRTQLDGL